MRFDFAAYPKPVVDLYRQLMQEGRMTGIYNFYITTDKRQVDLASNLYDELILEGNRVAWLRTERASSEGREPLQRAAADAESRPGEHYIGTVEL